MKRNNLLIIGFGIFAAALVAAFIFFTLTPYLQERIYIKHRRAQEFETVAQSDFIFAPYTNAQSVIRYDFLNYFIEKAVDRFSLLELDTAIEKAGELANKERQNPYYALLVGRGYDKKAELTGDAGFYATAEEWYQRALATAPDRQDIDYFYGLHLLAFGKSDEALKVLRDTLALDERVPLSHYYLGLALVGRGTPSYVEALGHMEFFLNAFDKWMHDDPEGASKAAPDNETLKRVYEKFLKYFYAAGDKVHFLETVSRLALIDTAQPVYQKIKEYIQETGTLPSINLQ